MNESAHIVDGDFGWTGINDRLHPSQLPQGTAAYARNVSFSYGEARPRWAINVAPWGHSSKLPGNPLAAARWFEPVYGDEFAVVVTDDPRDEAGEDGGIGRCYIVRPGGIPLEVSLGGHDVWGTSRLVAGRTALLLLRHGKQRFYVQGTAGSDTLTTRVANGFTSGDRVRVLGATVPQPLLNDSYYWIEKGSGNDVTLHSSPALGTAITLQTDGGVFALERATEAPGPGGDGAEVLLLQNGWANDAPLTVWQTGWASVPQNVSATYDGGLATIWTADNHRFANGEAVTLTSTWGGVTVGDPLYVHVLNSHQFTLHQNSALALLGSTALTGDAYSSTVTPAGASGQPIVPLREAVLYKNRTVGINERNNVAVSDPGDFLHFTPFSGALTLNVGNGDELSAIVPLGEDALLFPSPTQVLAITGLSVSSDAWRLIEVTRSYGCIAPLTAVQVGRQAWFLSRAGIVAVQQTEYGLNQGMAQPVSMPVSRKLDEVDYVRASQACAAVFNNKVLISVPLKGQESGAVTNNCTLVFNLLTGQWDGWWDGDGFNPVQYFILSIGLAERLCWLDADGGVKWFTEEGWEDVALTYDAGTSDWAFSNVAITQELRTRAYVGQHGRRKHWTEVELVVDTINPSYGVAAITEGYNQETAYRTAQTRDPAVFLTWNTADFNPATEPERANLPYREDYTMFEGTEPDSAVEMTFNPLDSDLNGVYVRDDGRYVRYTRTTDLGEWCVLEYVTAYNEWQLSHEVIGFIDTTAPGASVTNPSGATWLAYPDITIVDAPTTAIALPDEGAPADAHQTTQETVHIRERSRSVQVKLTNTQGSARWRAVHVKGTLERGDW